MLETVKIGWRYYTIHKAEPVLSSGDELYGQTDHDRQTIYLRAGNTQDQDNATLLHEVLHGVDDMYGLELSENTVTRLADALYTLYKDNNLHMIVKSGS